LPTTSRTVSFHDYADEHGVREQRAESKNGEPPATRLVPLAIRMMYDRAASVYARALLIFKPATASTR